MKEESQEYQKISLLNCEEIDQQTNQDSSSLKRRDQIISIKFESEKESKINIHQTEVNLTIKQNK